jgi:hypothetical protein
MVSKLKRLPTEWEKNLCQLYIWHMTAIHINTYGY